MSEIAYRIILITLIAAITFWVISLFINFIALMPWGIIGIIGLSIALFVIFAVWRHQANDKESQYYSKNVHK